MGNQGMVLLVAGILIVGGPAPGSAGIEPFPVSILPPTLVTGEESVFTVDLHADSGAAQFNAYEVTIAFAPDILEFQSVTEGSLMVSACGNTFDFLQTTDSTVTYSHSLLCGGISLDGPGVLSTYQFRAVSEGLSGIRIVSAPDSSFFDAGIRVSPLHPTRPRQVIFMNAIVAVGSDPTDGPESVVPPRGDLRVWPNPMRERGEVRFEMENTGWARLEILDVSGRRVFARAWPALARGAHRMEWSARDSGGRRLPGGVYVARLLDGQGVRSGKVALVR